MSLLCLWAVQDLGISLTALSKHLKIILPGFKNVVEREEAIVRDNNFQLVD